MKKLITSNALLLMLIMVLLSSCSPEENVMEELENPGITAQMVMDEIHLASIGKGKLVNELHEVHLQATSISEEVYAHLLEHQSDGVSHTWSPEQLESVFGVNDSELQKEREMFKAQEEVCMLIVMNGNPPIYVEVCREVEF